MAGRTRRRWLAAAIFAVALGGVTTAGVSLVGADGEQPPPGSVDATPDDVPPLGTQPPPGSSGPATEAGPALGTQPPNPHPDLTGPPTEVVGSEAEGSGRPSGPDEVETAVVGRPD